MGVALVQVVKLHTDEDHGEVTCVTMSADDDARTLAAGCVWVLCASRLPL
jgi:hypothetical protein